MTQQTFGKYQLLKKLATGGMAEVFLARKTGIEGFEKICVVKRILPHLADDPEFVQMFLNEAKIAARFSHPNIAQIDELGEVDGNYFIAMEFVRGEDLGRVMRKAWSRGQWVARPLAIRIVASCCEGLYYAHSRTDDRGNPLRVVHRDISPQNILISFDGSVKLVDFGIAKAANAQSMTRSGALKGKFAYMSPEQAAGKALDHRTDLFAMGLVLYELLTGVRPLKRDTELGTLQAALECQIEPPSKVADVPAELDGIVMAALAPNPDDRYRDARQLQMALEELLVSQGWVATSVQLEELMRTLFHERIEEEDRLGYPNPSAAESSNVTGAPARRSSSERADSAPRPSRSSTHRTPMPEAPPRPAPRPKTREAPPKPRVEPLDLDKVVDPVARARVAKLIALVAFVSIAAGAGFVFRDRISSALTATAKDPLELYVNVDSNLPVEVFVEHASDEGRSPEPVYLGRNPLTRAGGVHAGDTLVFENLAHGLRYRERIASGQPGEVLTVRKEFQTGHVRLHLEPKSLRDLKVFLHDRQVGSYPGAKLELVEGRHVLELRGEQLTRPAEVKIEVKPGITVDSPVSNLSPLLVDARAQ